MNGKMRAGFIALLCLFGAGFAMNGNGGMARQELPLEARAQFMEATHTGDYETAMALHEEYGIGGKRMEKATLQMFQLRTDIFEAMNNGDWMGAVQLQDEFRGLVKDAMAGILPQPGLRGHLRPMMQNGVEKPPLGKPPLEVEVAE